MTVRIVTGASIRQFLFYANNTLVAARKDLRKYEVTQLRNADLKMSNVGKLITKEMLSGLSCQMPLHMNRISLWQVVPRVISPLLATLSLLGDKSRPITPMAFPFQRK
jgi:hypothetical protein